MSRGYILFGMKNKIKIFLFFKRFKFIPTKTGQEILYFLNYCIFPNAFPDISPLDEELNWTTKEFPPSQEYYKNITTV